jgi:hypothetical protein
MRILALAATLVALVQGHAVAQRGLTRITGKVTADSGGPVAGVQIKAVFGGNKIFDTSSNDSGEWSIGGMGKGEWEIVFEKAGYAQSRAKVVLPVDLSRVPPIAVTLKKG